MPSDRPGASGPADGQPDDGPPDAESRVELLGDADRPRAWMLLADGVPQSYVDLDDPYHLELEYLRRLGHVIDLAGPAGVPLRVLHLGGGGLTLARYVAATRPGSHQLAAESDARIVVDEHWKCPAVRTLRPFLRHGVPLLLGSDSDDSETVGRYDYCADILRELRPLSVAAA